MSKSITIAAAKDADNIVSFIVFDTDGDPVDLDALGATDVKAEICSQLQNSTISAESFSSNTVSFQFGKLAVPAGSYKPKIFYISPAKPEGEILLAECFETSMTLKMVC